MAQIYAIEIHHTEIPITFTKSISVYARRKMYATWFIKQSKLFAWTNNFRYMQGGAGGVGELRIIAHAGNTLNVKAQL